MKTTEDNEFVTLIIENQGDNRACKPTNRNRELSDQDTKDNRWQLRPERVKEPPSYLKNGSVASCQEHGMDHSLDTESGISYHQAKIPESRLYACADRLFLCDLQIAAVGLIGAARE
jgi:hypothetical protein